MQRIDDKFHLRADLADLHGSGGPWATEVPRLGGVTNLSIQSLFFS